MTYCISGVDSFIEGRPSFHFILYIVNPRRACAARVTVGGSVGRSVCPLIEISPQECLFVLKRISHTQQAMKVKKFV